MARVRARGALLGTALTLAACARGGAAPPPPAVIDHVLPGPGPRARKDAAAANAACEGCHAEAATTWRASLHAQAWSDPVFQRSYEVEPSRFCRDCHAPESATPALGVACVTCHDPSGRGVVLAARAAPNASGQPAPAAPHPVQREAAFAGSGACASCHEFPFPDAAQRGHDGAQMQRTVTEHAASRFADRPCATCHMPRTARGGRAHGFAVASDPAMLRRALVVHVTRRGDAVAFDLAPGEVGHAVPTGDLFRRLVLVAEAVGDDHQLLAQAVRPLGRHFRFEDAPRGGTVQREVADDRVQGALHVDLELGLGARGQAIVWRIEWQRVQSMRGEEAVLADVVILDQGRLPYE